MPRGRMQDFVSGAVLGSDITDAQLVDYCWCAAAEDGAPNIHTPADAMLHVLAKLANRLSLTDVFSRVHDVLVSFACPVDVVAVSQEPPRPVSSCRAFLCGVVAWKEALASLTAMRAGTMPLDVPWVLHLTSKHMPQPHLTGTGAFVKQLAGTARGTIVLTPGNVPLCVTKLKATPLGL